MARRAPGWVAAAALLLATAVAGCAPAAGDAKRGEVRIFAASSLTAALQAAKPMYEASHKDSTLVLNLGASNALRIQIEQGAGADLFISAARKEVDPLVASGQAERVRPFVRNELVVAISPEGAARVDSLGALAGSGLRLVLADKATPIGDYTDQALNRMNTGGTFGPDFRGHVFANVRSYQHTEQEVLAKVLLGEADAGIVYRSSISPAAAAKGVKVLPIPEQFAPPVAFYLAVMKGADPRAVAFADWLTGADGQQLLRQYGFRPNE